MKEKPDFMVHKIWLKPIICTRVKHSKCLWPVKWWVLSLFLKIFNFSLVPASVLSHRWLVPKAEPWLSSRTCCGWSTEFWKAEMQLRPIPLTASYSNNRTFRATHSPLGSCHRMKTDNLPSQKLHTAHGKDVLPVAVELCTFTLESETADKCSLVTLSAELVQQPWMRIRGNNFITLT